jgi:hypothetical protein
MRLATGCQEATVGAEGKGLGPHTRQLDLKSGGGEELIGRGVVAVRADSADSLLGSSLGDRERG